MKAYKKTRLWLKFDVDLRSAPANLWVILGECQSKCEHISGVPLPPSVAQELHQIYFAKGVIATTAIEGNTLSEEDARRQLEGELEVEPSKEYLKQEIANIIRECNGILDGVRSGEMPALNSDRIKRLNRAVLDKLDTSEEVTPGEIRKYSVGVARYRGAPWEECPYLLERLCEWLGSETFEAPPGMVIVYAIVKAILAHLYLARIHPFGDGNGRTARLVEFQILMSSGVPAPAAQLLSNHYNQTRSEYYRQLDRASRSGGDVIPFLRYAAQGFLDGLGQQLKTIREMQLSVMWREYVYDAFKAKSGSANQRRRNLVLDLSASSDPVPLDELPGISRPMAKAYAGLTDRALSRDVNELVKMELVKKEGKDVRACKETILAFLPLKTSP